MSTKKLRSLLTVTAVASASLVGGSGLAYANLSDGVHGNTGAVDCTTGKECVKKVGDTAEVSYDIKVSPLAFSSDHVQTSRGFQILIPDVVKDVKITLTGVPEHNMLGSDGKDTDWYGVMPNVKPVNKVIPIKEMTYDDNGSEIYPEIDTTTNEISDFIKFNLKENNSEELTGAIYGSRGIVPSQFPEQPTWSAYETGITSIPGVYNLRVTGTVETSAEDTYIPIRVDNKMWRCSQEATGENVESGAGSYNEGCQKLKDFPWGRTGELPPVSMKGQSEETQERITKIYKSNGSEDGLFGLGQCAVTKNTPEQLNYIGDDVGNSFSAGREYADRFNLVDNPAITYIVPVGNEDGCDTGFFHIDLCDEEEKPTDTPATTPSTEPEETTSTTTTPTEPEDEDSLLDKLFPIIPVKPTEPTESTTTSTPTTSSSVPSTTSTAPSTTSTPMTSSTTPMTSSSTVTSTTTAPSTHTSQSVTETIKESHSETATIVIAPEKAIDDKPKAQPAKNAGPRITTGGSLR